MSIIIDGLTLPERGCLNVQIWHDGRVTLLKGGEIGKAMELPDHGDLVDAQMLDADLRKMMGRAMKKAEAEGCEEESYFVGRASAFVDARRLLNDWKRAVVIPAERSEE